MFRLSQKHKPRIYADKRGSEKLCLILVLLALPVSICAQTDPANDPWHERARNITEDLIVDGQKLPPLRRAVLRARLAERWWRDDPRRALGWLTMAVEAVEQAPEKVNLNQRRERLETTGLILKTAIRHDLKLARRLVAVLTNEDNTKGIEGLENADSLLTAAAAIVDLDSERAAELGALALRLGPPANVATLLIPLYRRNVRLADGLLAQAMAIAKQAPSSELLNSLTHTVFPPHSRRGGDPSPVPEDVRAELLKLRVTFLNARLNNGGVDCADVFGFVFPLLSEFERLVPEQAAVAHHAVKECQVLIPMGQPQPPAKQTVEGLLQAAAEAKNLNYRASFEESAANVSRSNKDYDRAFKILDGMSKESRERLGGAWETNRWYWAAEGAVHHYTNGRLSDMNRMLDGVPADWRAFAKAAFVEHLPDGQGDRAIEFLNDARVAFRQSRLPDSDKYRGYFMLVRLTVKYDPAAAGTALKEATASLNRADAAAAKDGKSLYTTDQVQTLSASLLEIDELALKEGLASIVSVETRAQLRLHLLQAALGRIKKQ